jgi:uncharacterized membrane protein
MDPVVAVLCLCHGRPVSSRSTNKAHFPREALMMRVLRYVCLSCFLLASSIAVAGPRSGSSLGGLRGFRSSPSSGLSRSYSGSRSYGRGSSFVFLPSFGWGYGGWGYGGGMGMVGSLMLVGIVGLGAVMVVRSMRRASQRRGLLSGPGYDEYDDVGASLDRAYVYKVQVGVGRSGRSIQQRLEEFAATGDTSSESGLADLLHQAALEILREKDALRYGMAEAGGPYSLTNGEAKLTGAATAERSRYQIERVRSSNGQVRRSSAEAAVGSEALEFLVVTVLLATRVPVDGLDKAEDRPSIERALATLGSVPANALLGLEVIWTPADPDDSMTETDLMTTYPDLRSL